MDGTLDHMQHVPSDTPAPLSSLLRSCFERDRDQRPTFGAVSQSLDELPLGGAAAHTVVASPALSLDEYDDGGAPPITATAAVTIPSSHPRHSLSSDFEEDDSSGESLLSQPLPPLPQQTT